MKSKFWVRDLYGSQAPYESEEQLRELLAQLSRAEAEHPDVSLSHASGWGLSFFNGYCVYENVEAEVPGPRHLRCTAPAEMMEIARMLLAEAFEDLEALPWKPGYQ